MSKPRLSDAEKKALLRVFVNRFGLIPLVTLALRAIGPEKVGLLLQFKDPGLTSADADRLIRELSKLTTTSEVITLAASAIGLDRVNEILDYLRSREDEPARPPLPADPGVATIPLNLSRPIFIGLTRHWSKAPAQQTALILADAGATGMSMELIELEDPAVQNTPARMFEYMTNQIRKAVPYVMELRNRGLLLKLYGWQSNVRAQAQLTLDQHKALIDEWGRRIGWRGVLVMWSNEDDEKQPASVREGAAAYLRQRMVEALGSEAAAARQLIAWNRRVAGYDWAEYHPSKVGAWPSPGPWSIFAPDNSGPLADLGSMIGSARPNEVKWAKLVTEARKKGYGAIDCYNFNTVLVPGWVKACVDAWGVAAVPEQPVPAVGDSITLDGAMQVCETGANNLANLGRIPAAHVLRSARIEGDKVRLDYTVPASYWRGTATNQLARLHVYWTDGTGRVTGGHFEWLRADGGGQKVKLLQNIYNGYLTVRPAAGVRLHFVVIANGGEARTNAARAS